MRRIWLLTLVLTMALSGASAHAQTPPLRESSALHTRRDTIDGPARRRWTLLPGKLAAAMLVSGAASAPSYAGLFAAGGFVLPAVLPLYAAGPLGAAGAIHAFERRHGGVSRYRGACFGAMFGTLAGAIGSGYVIRALRLSGDADMGKGVAVATATTALGASVFGVLGDEVSTARQRALRTRRVEVSASFTPLREGGLAGAVAGRF